MPDQIDERGVEVNETKPTRQPIVNDRTLRQQIISPTIDVAAVIAYITSAERGLIRYQMEMFDRMVERDPHLQAVLQTRRLALTSAEWTVVSGDETDSRANEAAEFVWEQLRGLPSFEDDVQSMLDGIAKGIAVTEIVYDDDYGLADLVEVPQRLLDWQKPELRVMADGIHPVPMEPNKYIVHSPRLRPGPPLRRGLMRTLAIYWCISHYAMEDWASYSEVYGMPLRVGKYKPGTKDGDLAVLFDALKSLGADAVGAIPDDMTIEFPEPHSKKLSGEKTPMQSIIDHIEKKMSIAVIGQHLTTQSESGSGTLAGNAQERVMRSITKGDARQLNTSVRSDLFRPLVGFRFGWDVTLPVLKWDLDDPVDQESRGKVFAIAKNELGMDLSKAQVRDELQLDEPADDEDTLEGKKPMPVPPAFGGGGPPPPPQGGTDEGDDGDQRDAEMAAFLASGAPVVGPPGSAMRANAEVARKASETAGDHLLSVIDAIAQLADGAKSLEEIQARLDLAIPNLDDVLADAGVDGTAFNDLLARAMVTGSLNGYVAVKAESTKQQRR